MPKRGPKKQIKKVKKQIKRLKKRGGDPMKIQALTEKKRTLKGKTATQPGDVGPGGYQTAGEWAGGMAKGQGIDNSIMAGGIQTDQYGNIVETVIDPKTGRPTTTTKLGDYEQGAQDAQRGWSDWQRNQGQQAYGQAGQAMSQPYGSMYQGLPQMPGQQGQQAFRQDIEQRLYDDQARLNEPAMAREREDFEQMAASRGWTPGSEVYNEQKALMGQNQAETRRGWGAQATQQGLTEQQGMYNLSATDRNRLLGEAKDQRYGSYQEAQGLMQGAGGPQMGQFRQFAPGQAGAQNFGGMAGQFAGMQQQPWLDRQKYAHEMAMLNQQQAGAGGGGGENLTAQQQADMKFAYEQRMRNAGLGQYYDGGGGGGGGTDWAGMGGALVGGALQGWGSSGFAGL